MNLQDATLVFLTESAAFPSLAALAKSAYDRMIDGEPVDYTVLDELIGEASGKGVLRAMKQKHGPVAFEAIISPILHEIDRAKPIRSSRAPWEPQPSEDPLAVRH